MKSVVWKEDLGEFGRWSIDLPDKRDGKWAVPHRQGFRLKEASRLSHGDCF